MLLLLYCILPIYNTALLFCVSSLIDRILCLEKKAHISLWVVLYEYMFQVESWQGKITKQINNNVKES
jgi:hypothetical protein